MSKRMTGRLFVFALLSLVLALNSTPTKAEMYVAGQVGVTIPQSFSSVEYSAFGVTLRGNDLSMQNSLMYGAKAGYYFDSLKWQNFNLGVETEVFNTNPNIKEQNYTIAGVNLGTGPGVNARILNWAPVNIVVRYQAGAFEPYAGVGFGVFFSHFSQAGGGSSTGTDVGLNTQLGLRYRVTNNVSLFGEWKYNHANLSNNNFVGTNGLKVSGDYNANILAFGLGYHF
jgi:opacity protein-like surface antigen